MVKKQIQILPELYNNIGVVRTQLGKQSNSEKYESAEKAFQTAIELVKEKDVKAKAILCSVSFNLACLYESMSKFGDA